MKTHVEMSSYTTGYNDELVDPLGAWKPALKLRLVQRYELHLRTLTPINKNINFHFHFVYFYCNTETSKSDCLKPAIPTDIKCL